MITEKLKSLLQEVEGRERSYPLPLRKDNELYYAVVCKSRGLVRPPKKLLVDFSGPNLPCRGNKAMLLFKSMVCRSLTSKRPTISISEFT